MRFTSQQNFGVFSLFYVFMFRVTTIELGVAIWLCLYVCLFVCGRVLGLTNAHQPGRHLSQMHQTRMKVTGHGPLCTRCPSPQGGHFDLLDFRLLQPLGLGATILKPNFHLCLGETQRWRELCPLRDAQVLLLPELLLQRQQLLCGEGSARLAVRFVFAQIALDAWRLVGICNREREKEMERVLISLMLSKRRWLLRCLRCWLAACLGESRGQLKATKSATFAYNWKRPTRCCQVPTDWRLPVLLPPLCSALSLALPWLKAGRGSRQRLQPTVITPLSGQ